MAKLKLQTLTEVHRPPRFKGIIDVKGNIPRIKRIIKNKKKQQFLFIGPPGGGKTTAAWATAREFVETNMSPATRLMGGSIDDCIIYINASDAGIDVVRSIVKPAVSVSGVTSIILDEFDGITKKSQHALRSIIEESERKISPKQFILTANYSSKIIDPIISRCGAEAFSFPKIPFDLMLPELMNICKLENIAEFIFSDEIMADPKLKKKAFKQYWQVLYDTVNGDMRKALKHLDATIDIDSNGRKTLDMSSEPIDLTTNAYYLQLDELLLADSQSDYTKLVDSIEELIYRREGNVWETATFFTETFKWLKDRSDRFDHKVVLRLAEFIAEYAYRMQSSVQLDLQNQLVAMISGMRTYLRDEDLEKKQLTELHQIVREAREIIKELKK